MEGAQNENYLTQQSEINLRREDFDNLHSFIDKEINGFFERFQDNSEPVKVNFRKLVSWIPYSDSHTHLIHQYPAKLLKHIPIFFLNSKILLKKDMSIVLDPFCGTGTVLLESMLAGHKGIGCDSNPLARLIAEVKVSPIAPFQLQKHLSSLVMKAKKFRRFDKKNVVNIDHWFPKETQKKLSNLYRAINEVEDLNEKNFLLVTFSNIVKKVSLSDPNLSVPVSLKPEKYRNSEVRNKLEKMLNDLRDIDVYKVFEVQLKKNISRMAQLHKERLQVTCQIVGADARNITVDLSSNSRSYESNTVDYILTSPPYAGAQKYIRSSSLNLGWLEFCEDNTLRDHEKKNIGREHYSKSEYLEPIKLGIYEIDQIIDKIWKISPIRSHINGNYLLEMQSALKEMYRVLKPDCYCTIVIGNNTVCGLDFETYKYLSKIAERIGFSLKLVLVDDIHSRGLMTKRNKTASIINSEWILVFKK